MAWVDVEPIKQSAPTQDKWVDVKPQTESSGNWVDVEPSFFDKAKGAIGGLVDDWKTGWDITMNPSPEQLQAEGTQPIFAKTPDISKLLVNPAQGVVDAMSPQFLKEQIPKSFARNVAGIAQLPYEIGDAYLQMQQGNPQKAADILKGFVQFTGNPTGLYDIARAWTEEGRLLPKEWSTFKETWTVDPVGSFLAVLPLAKGVSKGIGKLKKGYKEGSLNPNIKDFYEKGFIPEEDYNAYKEDINAPQSKQMEKKYDELSEHAADVKQKAEWQKERETKAELERIDYELAKNEKLEDAYPLNFKESYSIKDLEAEIPSKTLKKLKQTPLEKPVSPTGETPQPIETPTADILGNESGFLKLGKEDLFKHDEKTNIQKAVRGADQFLGIISTRVGNISPELKTRLKRHAFDKAINTSRDAKRVKDFYKQSDKLPSKDQVTITQLLHNGDFEGALKVFKDNGINPNGFADALKLIGELTDKGNKAGMKIEKKINNYFPSSVANYEGLMKHLEETGRGNVASQIEKAIKLAEEKAGSLTVEDRGVIANKMLRGFPQNKVNLSDPTYAKNRTMGDLSFEDARFYRPFHEELLRFITDMDKKIADNKLFGKGNQPSVADMKAKKLYGFDYSELGIENIGDVDSSIGYLLESERSKGRKFTNQEERDLRSMIKSYLNPHSINPAVRTAKSATYTALLTDVSTALTQLQSEGLTIGMFANTPKKLAKYYLPAWGKVITRKGLKLADIGIDSAATDFERKGISPVITKVIGSAFRLMDVANKEALSNTIQRTYKDLAKNKDPKFMKTLEEMYGKEAERVRNEIISGEKTDDAMFTINSTVAEYHPISELEVPQKYLDSSAWNMLMTLHTYQIKQAHIYREKVYNEIKSGNVKEGIKNMVNLTVGLIAVGMPINYLQDFIKGKDPDDIKAYFMDSALQIIGMNKYMYDRVVSSKKTEKVAAVLKPITPAILDIAKNIVADTITAFESEKSTGLIKSKTPNYKTFQYLPLVGKELYSRTDAYQDMMKKYNTPKYQGLIKER